jgi:hypothetical protein
MMATLADVLLQDAEALLQARDVDRAIILFDGVDEVVTWGARAPASPPRWDMQMELMELPYFFRTQLSELPVAERYLKMPRARDLGRAAGTLRVGLVWASGSWDPLRSVPLESLLGVLQQRECEFWILQGGSRLADAETLDELPPERA